jgi:hypothetical protein
VKRVQRSGTGSFVRTGCSASRSLIALLVISSFAGPAAAEEVEVGPRLETRQEGKLLWIDAVIPEMEASHVVVKLMAPDRSGQRTLWQRCEFGYTGAGTYSCGFQVGPGSDSARTPGVWAARLVADGVLLDRLTFDVPGVRPNCRNSAQYRRQHRAACARARRPS